MRVYDRRGLGDQVGNDRVVRVTGLRILLGEWESNGSVDGLWVCVMIPMLKRMQKVSLNEHLQNHFRVISIVPLEARGCACVSKSKALS
jgi:hypothetical protein